RDLLKPVVNKENKLHTGRVMSHVAFNKLSNYPKLIINTDGGMVIAPTLEEKKGIILNAVAALHAIGYVLPKVAVLAGVEKPNPKMPETLEAAALQEMNERGEISGCLVCGPLSYDIAISGEVAKQKKFPCPYAGDFDVLVAPNLAAGNILGKCWSFTAGSVMAGMIMGAKVPIILTSRGAPAEEKFLSIAIASLV
ncbi:MAG: phosphate acyltransferase, partial [Clostridiales bacterium]